MMGDDARPLGVSGGLTPAGGQEGPGGESRRCRGTTGSASALSFVPGWGGGEATLVPPSFTFLRPSAHRRTAGPQPLWIPLITPPSVRFWGPGRAWPSSSRSVSRGGPLACFSRCIYLISPGALGPSRSGCRSPNILGPALLCPPVH